MCLIHRSVVLFRDMKKFAYLSFAILLVGFFTFFITNSASATNSPITVLVPNDGGDLTRGTMQPITYESQVASMHEIKLVTLPPSCAGNSCPVYTIANTQAPTYLWHVGRTSNNATDNIPNGSYVLQVCQSGTNICDIANNRFTINNAAPVISSIGVSGCSGAACNNAYLGQTIDINGSNFTANSYVLSYISLTNDYKSIKPTFLSANQLKFTIPLDAKTGGHKIQVTNQYNSNNGTSQLSTSNVKEIRFLPTIEPSLSYKATLNNTDYPSVGHDQTIKVKYGDPVTLSWQSNGDYCEGYEYNTNTPWNGRKNASGSQVLTNMTVGKHVPIIYCYSSKYSQGVYGKDDTLIIEVAPASTQKTATVTGRVLQGNSTLANKIGASAVVTSNGVFTPTDTSGYFTLSNIPLTIDNVAQNSATVTLKIDLTGTAVTKIVQYGVTAGTTRNVGDITMPTPPTTDSAPWSQYLEAESGFIEVCSYTQGIENCFEPASKEEYLKDRGNAVGGDNSIATGKYFTDENSTNGAGGARIANTASTTLQFTPNSTNKYYIWGRVLATSSTRDSFHVKLSDRVATTVSEYDVYDDLENLPDRVGKWTWTRVNGRGCPQASPVTESGCTLLRRSPRIFPNDNPGDLLAKGQTYRITFKVRDGNSKLDKIFITSDPNQVPSDSGTVAGTEISLYDFGDVTLKQGSTGIAVQNLQKFLNDKLYKGLVVDGKFGLATLIAVKEFQAIHALTADGAVGTNTKAAMNSGL